MASRTGGTTLSDVTPPPPGDPFTLDDADQDDDAGEGCGPSLLLMVLALVVVFAATALLISI